MDSKLDNLTQSELDALKVGDTIYWEYGGYRAGKVIRGKIVRITDKYIFTEAGTKISRANGMLYPRDKYINAYLGKFRVKNVSNE